MGELQAENRTLFTGDNLEVMRAINSETVDLIYLDPPFNKKYVFIIGDDEGFGYKDIWGWDTPESDRNPFLPHAELYAFDELVAATTDGNPLIDGAMAKKIVRLLETIGQIAGEAEMAYLSFMAARLVEMRRLLKPTGSIYLHCDPTMSHSLKLLMDIVFGDFFQNEIIWSYRRWPAKQPRFQSMHDIIFYYTKGNGHAWNQQYEPLADSTVKRFKGKKIVSGAKNSPEGRPPSRTEESDSPSAPMRDVWNIGIIAPVSKERTGYPTQKPLALLERIIKASSNEGDFVLDPFCGCATTCIAAERLNRRWIGIDVAEKAATLVKARLNAETKQGNLAEGMRKVHHRMFNKGDCPMRTDLGDSRSKNIRKILYGLQEGNCNLCKTHFAALRHLTDDHIIPRKKGGPDVDRNLQLLCGSCNSIKNTRTMEQARKRLRELGYIA